MFNARLFQEANWIANLLHNLQLKSSLLDAFIEAVLILDTVLPLHLYLLYLVVLNLFPFGDQLITKH